MKGERQLSIVCGLAATIGFIFAAVSTSDFVAHLDRQVHGIHCSFLPGLASADQSGESGCHVTLMSPYSSVFRQSIWGGIPIALPAMAVFAFLGFWSFWIALNDRDTDPRSTGFLALGTLVPLSASVIMGYLSLVELDAACKLCIGIYASSGALTLAALVLWLKSRATVRQADERISKAELRPPLSWTTLGLAFATGVATVAVTVGAYAATAPDFSNYVGSCGQLPEGALDSDILIDYGPQTGRPRMLEVMDPLCPSCRAFEDRLEKMPTAAEIDRQLLLFPLDEKCNWMIDRSIHPGACEVSKAVLCADDPKDVISWAFENQQRIMEATDKDPRAAERLVTGQFPALSDCVNGPKAEARLNQSLRLAVKNRLQVLTPQVFVDGVRLCGEDTDLGLDFALPRLIDMTRNRTRMRKDLRDQDSSASSDSQASSSPVGVAPARQPSSRPAAGPEQDSDSDRRKVLAAKIREEAEEAPDAGAPIDEGASESTGQDAPEQPADDAAAPEEKQLQGKEKADTEPEPSSDNLPRDPQENTP